jgi:hypothetical protein
MIESPAADEWVDLSYASARTGFSPLRLLRLIQDGDMPAMQIAGGERKSHRVPKRLVDEAYAAVMHGGQIELREFARQWAARNAGGTEAVA